MRLKNKRKKKKNRGGILNWIKFLIKRLKNLSSRRVRLKNEGGRKSQEGILNWIKFLIETFKRAILETSETKSERDGEKSIRGDFKLDKILYVLGI